MKYYRKYQLIKHMSSKHPLSDLPEIDFDASLDEPDLQLTRVGQEMIRSQQGRISTGSPTTSAALLYKPSPSHVSSIHCSIEEDNMHDNSFESILEEPKLQVGPAKTITDYCKKVNPAEEHCRKDEQDHTPSDIIKRQKKQHPEYMEFDSFKSFTSLQLSSSSGDCDGEFTPKDFRSLGFGMDSVFMSRKTTSFDSYFESL